MRVAIMLEAIDMFSKRTKTLLLRDTITGKWVLPGGLIEEGEDPEEILNINLMDIMEFDDYSDVVKIYTDDNGILFKGVFNDIRNPITIGRVSKHSNHPDFFEYRWVNSNQTKRMVE